MISTTTTTTKKKKNKNKITAIYGVLYFIEMQPQNKIINKQNHSNLYGVLHLLNRKKKKDFKIVTILPRMHL